MKKFIIAAVFSILLCGCQNVQDIDRLNFVLAAGIDKGQEESIALTAGCAFPDLSGASVEAAVFKGEGDTLPSAMENTGKNDSRQIYYGHVKAILLSREFLEDNALILDFIDTIERESNISLKTAILYTDEKAGDIIKNISESGKDSSLYIWDYYKTNDSTGTSAIKTDFEEFTRHLRTNGCALIPKIDFDGENIVIAGGAIIKDGIFLCEVSKEELEGYFIALEEAEGKIAECAIDGEKAAVKIENLKCDIDFYEENNELYCLFNQKAEGYVMQMPEKSDIENVSKILSSKLDKEILDTFKIFSEKNSDVFGITDELRKDNFYLYEKYGEEKAFENMNFKSICDFKILGGGLKK